MPKLRLLIPAMASCAAHADFEMYIVWMLVAFRLYGGTLFYWCLPSVDQYESNYNRITHAFRAYSYYVPVEAMISIVCWLLCFRKLARFTHKTDVNIWKHFLLVIMPLIIASIYSFHWLFFSYPMSMNTQFNYFDNQRQTMQELMSYEGVINKEKLQEALMKRLEKSRNWGKGRPVSGQTDRSREVR